MPDMFTRLEADYQMPEHERSARRTRRPGRVAGPWARRFGVKTSLCNGLISVFGPFGAVYHPYTRPIDDGAHDSTTDRRASGT
jgi:hypothetical protein